MNAAIEDLQDGHCLMCNSPIEHRHHIVPRNMQGSNTIGNIAGLCCKCHERVHKDARFEDRLKKKKAGLNKRYAAVSVLNQAIPFICKRLEQEFGKEHVHYCSGRDTSCLLYTSYKKHPEKYLEKPKMPHYKKKRSISTITFSNQGCKIKEGNILRFALTNETIHLPYQPEGRLKEVKVKPYYGDLLLVCTFECPDPEEKVKGSGACAIDLGVENIAADVYKRQLIIHTKLMRSRQMQ